MLRSISLVFPLSFLYLLSLCPAVSLRPDVLPVSALIAYYSANPSPILLLLFLFFLLFSLFHSHVPLLTLPLSFPLPALVPVPLHSSSHQFVPSPFLLSPSLPSSPFSNSPCPTRSISLHSDSHVAITYYFPVPFYDIYSHPLRSTLTASFHWSISRITHIASL